MVPQSCSVQQRLFGAAGLSIVAPGSATVLLAGFDGGAFV